MKSLYKYLVGAIALAVVAGCTSTPVSGPDKVVTVTPEAGRFGLSHMENMGKRQTGTSVKEGENVNFDLGKIRGSTGFYFLLYNIGSRPITDVALTIEDAGFAVYPNSIDTLQPGNDVGMLPIVKVSAFHGTPYDGVGNRPLLAKGENSVMLKISGVSKTATGNDTVIELRAQMTLTALLMDFTLGAPSGPINLVSNFPRMFSYSETDLPDIAMKKMNDCGVACVSDSFFTISNTGNVPLQLTIFAGEYPSDMNGKLMTLQHVSDTVLATGSSLDVSDRYTTNSPSKIIIISGENTVCDPSKMIIEDNGNCYLQVHSSGVECAAGTNKSALELYLDPLKAEMAETCSGVYAVIDTSIVFFGRKCSGVPVEYSLYNLTEGTTMCRIIGNDDTKCTDPESRALLDTIIANLEGDSPDIKTLGLSRDRISGGGTLGVPWSPANP